jgi:hypothetical protein
MPIFRRMQVELNTAAPNSGAAIRAPVPVISVRLPDRVARLLTEFDHLYDTRSNQDPANRDRHGIGGLLGTEIESYGENRDAARALSGISFLVSTCASVEEPEEIWRDIGKLSGGGEAWLK